MLLIGAGRQAEADVQIAIAAWHIDGVLGLRYGDRWRQSKAVGVDIEIENHATTGRGARRHRFYPWAERHPVDGGEQRFPVADRQITEGIGGDRADRPQSNHRRRQQDGGALGNRGGERKIREQCLFRTRQAPDARLRMPLPVPPQTMAKRDDDLGAHRTSSGAGSRKDRNQPSGWLKLGSDGSVTSRSRSQPSFSSFRDWMATALALASSSGNAWNSETQQR